VAIKMVDIERIPAEARWKLATRAATSLFVASGRAYREAAKGRFNAEMDEAARLIWSEAGKEQGVIAQAFGLPVDNAENVAETFMLLSRVYLGAELKGNVRKEEGDRAVVLTANCPFLKRALEQEIDPESNFNCCNGYAQSAIQSLNPAYEMHFDEGMCKGDSQCAMRIERRK
jgi:hypothetical protein